jgi:hypothetical protein
LDTNAKIWVNTDMPEVNVFSLAVQNNNLFAGTGTKVWRRPLSEILTGVNDMLHSASGFTLYQNYPNPFSSNTGIEYSLSTSGHVTLSVYNIHGQQIDLLEDEDKPAGIHCIFFERPDLPEGLYYCRLKIGTQVETRKMIKKN